MAAQVYAYSASAVQVAILRLFVRCECLLPNLFVGTVSRESVLSALKCGLAAEDIIGYLRTHAHPQVAQRMPVVPEARSSPFLLLRARGHLFTSPLPVAAALTTTSYSRC